MSWDAQGLVSAVATRGTMNHPGDVDEGWSVEMAIPLRSLSFWGDRPVRDSTQWRLNFSRVEWDREVREGQYWVRKDSTTGRRLPEHNWVWSPQGYVDMHMPEKWAYLQFSAHRGEASAVGGKQDTVAFAEPADAAEREMLWMIYEKQQQYLREQGQYAETLRRLGLVGGGGIKMQATDRQFVAMVNSSGAVLSIDQDGEIRQVR